MEHYSIPKLLKSSTCLNFVTRKWIEVNDLSDGKCSANKKAQGLQLLY